MENKKLEEYKNKLNKERALIEREITENDQPLVFNEVGDRDDKEEEADQEDALSNQLAVVADLKKRLGNIESALQKIENGKYGMCENCGKGISDEVLSIDPESQLCQDCKLAA